MGGCGHGLLALSRARHSGLHGVHDFVFSIAVVGLHADALSEILGRPAHDSGAVRACDLGRVAVVGFASSTYFPLPEIPWLQNIVQFNPLHHLCEGLRWLLLRGEFTHHLAACAGLCVLLILGLCRWM